MKIAIVAGGTGGHVYPALTLAEELEKRGNEVVFVGSNSRMEKDVVPSRGFKYIGLDVEIFAHGLKGKLLSTYTILKEYRHCLKLLKDFDMAIGFGNYISLPIMLAAKRIGLKTVIHEQNSFAGKANKFLDKSMDLVIGSYEENRSQFKNPNTLILGNPQASKALSVKANKKVLEDLGLDNKKKTVVIMMGSLGSQTVNEVVLNYFDLVDDSYQIVYATGKQNWQTVIDKNITKKNIVCLESIDGVKLMKNSDLLVCRAGATTLAEITAMGMPSILIPSPYVPNNHQFFNAKALVDRDAAVMLEEKDLNSESLNKKIKELINNDKRLKTLGKNAKALGNPNVLEDIVEAIERL